jgi:large subunit ribosomal protein L6
MSRVGKKPVVIPNGVDVTIDGNTVSVKGPKGLLSENLNEAVSIALSDVDGAKTVIISVANETDKNERSQWGTARALISNMVIGVTDGFSKQLEVNGVGYRVNLSGRNVVLNVGYSHEVPYQLPEGVDATVEGNLITISGASKHMVGEVADNIRKIRKPEPYKGKGIKYIDEVIRRKAGKTQKAGE